MANAVVLGDDRVGDEFIIDIAVAVCGWRASRQLRSWTCAAVVAAFAKGWPRDDRWAIGEEEGRTNRDNRHATRDLWRLMRAPFKCLFRSTTERDASSSRPRCTPAAGRHLPHAQHAARPRTQHRTHRATAQHRRRSYNALCEAAAFTSHLSLFLAACSCASQAATKVTTKPERIPTTLAGGRERDLARQRTHALLWRHPPIAASQRYAHEAAALRALSTGPPFIP